MPVFVDHRLKLIYEDLQQIPEDDPYRHEILDGMHVATPAPVYRHQTISRRIQFQLYRQIELAGKGEVVYAPADVELGTYDVVEPDIFVILAEHRDQIERTHVRGVPDLVIEILSPLTAGRDRGIKRERYELAGVPEYWIVDPEEELVEAYRLVGSAPDNAAPGDAGPRVSGPRTAAPGDAAPAFAPPERCRDSVTFRAPHVTATVDLSRVWNDPAGEFA